MSAADGAREGVGEGPGGAAGGGGLLNRFVQLPGRPRSAGEWSLIPWAGAGGVTPSPGRRGGGTPVPKALRGRIPRSFGVGGDFARGAGALGRFEGGWGSLWAWDAGGGGGVTPSQRPRGWCREGRDAPVPTVPG